MRANTAEYLRADQLEDITGLPASTFRYWAAHDETVPPEERKGPRSIKLGRRRVWKRTDVLAWLEERELARD